MDIFIFALLLSLLAGLSTTIGCVIAFFLKNPSPAFISIIMGFSAGVMILVSFVELLNEAISSNGYIPALLLFFFGLMIMFLLDYFISHQYEFEDSMEILIKDNGSCERNYHYTPHLHPERGKKRKQHGQSEVLDNNIQQDNNSQKTPSPLGISFQKTSVFVFLGVFIHNLPEGMATFIGTIKEIELGILLAIAISLHNIPEGIAVSTPIYLCTGSRARAFFWSFLSGISEFIGALIVGLFLYPFINDYLLGGMLAIVAGVMVYISLDELLPVSRSFGKEHHSILGLIAGMFVMAVSLFIL